MPPRSRGHLDDDRPLALDDVRHALDQLATAVGTALDQVPRHGRNPTKLARTLNLKVPLCHKLIRAISAGEDVLDAVQRLPGPEGLQQILIAAARHGASETAVMSAREAVAQWSTLIARAGGSVTKLASAVERLTNQLGVRPVARTKLEAKRAIVDAYADLLGVRCHSLLRLMIASPDPVNPELTRGITIIGREGMVRSPGCAPATYTHLLRSRTAMTSDDPEVARDEIIRSTLAQCFSTPGVPSKVWIEPGQNGAHDAEITHIDPDLTFPQPLTVFNGPMRSKSDPSKSTSTGVTPSAIGTRIATHWFIFDLWMHKRYHAGSIVNCGAFDSTGRPTPVVRLSQRERDRLPDEPTLLVLPRPPAKPVCEQSPALSDLTEWIFEIEGLDRRDFVGHRMLIEYPLPMAQYVISFEQER